jgi:NADPH-dependent 2,4-dienoyl-CoA reductase/sulfur reductase-like enzyme
MKQFQERYPSEYDVIVAGGGPAGVAAAVSAARQGAKTALIERYGILGGMLTAGQVQPILGRAEGRTMYNEIVEML